MLYVLTYFNLLRGVIYFILGTFVNINAKCA